MLRTTKNARMTMIIEATYKSITNNGTILKHIMIVKMFEGNNFNRNFYRYLNWKFDWYGNFNIFNHFIWDWNRVIHMCHNWIRYINNNFLRNLNIVCNRSRNINMNRNFNWHMVGTVVGNFNINWIRNLNFIWLSTRNMYRNIIWNMN